MSDLKISVQDFRAIHRADIDLNGITVIAGVNGSGKSTLSRLLYTIFNKVKTLDDVYWSVFYSETFAIREVCQQIYDTLKPSNLNLLFGTTVEEVRNEIQKAISLLTDSIRWQKPQLRSCPNSVILKVIKLRNTLPKMAVA